MCSLNKVKAIAHIYKSLLYPFAFISHVDCVIDRAKCDSSWPFCWFLASQIRRLSHREMGTARKELPVFSSWKRIELYEWILWGTKVSREWKRCGMQFFRRPIISRHDRVGMSISIRHNARIWKRQFIGSESTEHNFVWTNYYCGHPLTDARARSTNPIT